MRSGEVVALGKGFAEEIFVADLGTKRKAGKRKAEMNFRRAKQQVFSALSLGIRDYVRKCGFKSVILGLSGGIDSALVAVLAADALGAENVLGVAMPARYSSERQFDGRRGARKKSRHPLRSFAD